MISRLKRYGYQKKWTCSGNELEEILVYDDGTQNVKVKSTRDNQKSIQSFADSVDYNRIIKASNNDLSQVVRDVPGENLGDVSGIQQYVDNPSKLNAYLTKLQTEITALNAAQKQLQDEQTKQTKEVKTNE